MKQFLIAILTLVICSTTAQAKEISCTGINLIKKLEKDDPALAKAITKEASALPYGKGIVWQIRKPGVEPSYVFGTMHLSDPRLLKLPPNAQTAFDNSHTLALEITEILDPKVMAGMALQVMQFTAYLDGLSLDDKMSAKEKAVVEKRARDHAGLPWNVASKIKPWALMAQIALPACEVARKKAGKPFLDMALGQRAKQQGKKLVGLETLQSQLETMSGLPEKLMIKSLIETAMLGDKVDDMIATMTDLYLAGDTGTVWAMMRKFGPTGIQKDQPDVAGYAEFQEVVIDRRNFHMADESEKLIKLGGAFIAVGALHLPGEKGLLNILAQRGYSVNAF